MTKQNKRQPFSMSLHFRFWKWDFSFSIMDKIWKDHQCMNGWIDGDYECEVCNP